jgi:hypothetical protein
MGSPPGRWMVTFHNQTPGRRSMTKRILLALIALAATTGNALAQSRSFYNASGRSVGRSSTDSSGTITNYDVRGKVNQPRGDDRQHDDDLRCRRPQHRAVQHEPLEREPFVTAVTVGTQGTW